MSLDTLLLELTCGDDARAEAAAAGFAQVGVAALSDLKTLLASENADVRWWAGRALAEIEDPAVNRLLQGLLTDPEPAVRQCAALGLRKQPDAQSIPALSRLLSDPDPLCAALAGDALATIGTPSVPALIEVLEKAALPARLEAARALAQIGDPRAIPALFKALTGESALLDYWATEGLERMGVGMVYFKPE